MESKKPFSMILAVLVVANCSGGSDSSSFVENTVVGNDQVESDTEDQLPDEVASARFGDVVDDELDADFSVMANGEGSVSNSVGLVAYSIGYDGDTAQGVAASGYRIDGGVGSVVTTGTVNYDTQYGLGVLSGISRSTTGAINSISADTRYREEGELVLSADFDNGSLTGSDSAISVDGSITGGDVSGSVTVYYEDGFVSGVPERNATMTTSLEGAIGADGVIGRFKGTDGDNVSVAGGFVGEATE